MKEQSKSGFYPGNNYLYNINNGNGLPNLIPGTYSNQFIPYINNYQRQNTNISQNQLLIQMQDMKKEIEELKLMNKMIINQINMMNDNFNNQKYSMINEKKELDQKIDQMQLEINDLRAFDERIIKKLDEMDEAVKSIIDINSLNDGNLGSQIKLLNEKLKLIENELAKLKQDIGEKNQKNIEKIHKLETEIKELKLRINELQSLFVGRKIIKIILKIILDNCFENYFGIGTTITVQGLKQEKYTPYKKIANNLIEIVLKKNKIIHINEEINKIIDVINERSTYGDLLNLIKDSLKQNDYENIKTLLNEKLLFNKECKDEIIGPDEDLASIINKTYK